MLDLYATLVKLLEKNIRDWIMSQTILLNYSYKNGC